MIRATIQIENKIASRLDGITHNSQDLRPAWPKIANAFYEIEREQFESQGARSGGWQELSAQSSQWKAVHYPGKPILQRSGALLSSLTNPDDPNAIYDAQPNSLTLGSSLVYGQYHQTGTGKMPSRPPILLTKGDVDRMGDIARTELSDIALQLGFDVVGYAGFGGS